MNVLSTLGRTLGQIWPEQVYQVVRATERKIQLGFMFALALLVVLGIASYQMAHKLREADQREAQLTTALAKIETILSLLKNAEDDERGYVITGDERYLGSYQSEGQTIERDLHDLEQLTARYPGSERKIARLKPMITTRLAEILQTIGVRRSQGFDPALKMILEQEDKPLMDDIETLIGELRNDQEQSLIQRAEESDARERDMLISIISGSLVAIMLVAYAAFLIDQDIRARKRADENLRKSRDQLAIILQGVADGILVRDATRLIYANEAAAKALGYSTLQELIEAPAEEMRRKITILDEFDRPLDADQLPETLALRGERQRETILRYHMLATGEDRWMVVKATPAFDQSGHVQYAISILHDITERIQAYHMLELRVEERTHEIERRRQVAEGLRDILTILNSNHSLDEILDSIVAQACHLLGSDVSAVYRLSDQHDLLHLQAARGLETDGAELSVPIGWNTMDQVILTRQPVAIANMAAPTDDTPVPGVGKDLPAGVADVYRRYRALLAVPVMIKHEVYGAIALYYERPREFSREEIEMAVAFGDQAALAIENARLRTQSEQMAAAAERSRLARDLHDAVTQTLFSTSLIADVLPRLWERNRDDALQRLEELRALTRGALAEMRALLLELRPATLTEIGLAQLLRLQTEAVTGRARVPASLAIEGQPHLPPDTQLILYRITQEALNNVARHASASHVAVSLRCRPEQTELQISDDGQGFDPTEIAQGHLGLAIMRERAETIGALLSIESRPGSGTRILVIWPRPHGGSAGPPVSERALALGA